MKKHDRLIWPLVVLSLLGLLDAVYLTTRHYQGDFTCSGITKCETVLTSSYATIGPVPLAVLGIVYYGVIFVSSLLLLANKNARLRKALTWLTLVGVLASLWFVSLQAFVIDAWCIFCLFSATTSTLLFLWGSRIMWVEKHGELHEDISGR